MNCRIWNYDPDATIEYMRKFYQTYSPVLAEKSQTVSGISKTGKPQTVSEELSLTRISQTLSAKLPLSWSHYLFLMGIPNVDERKFYELEAANEGLSLREMKHKDLGQMQMYVNYFDRYVKLDAKQPTIGIILCKKKKESLVEITLPKDANIHAAKYQTYLPDKESLKNQLEEAQQEWESHHADRGEHE